MSEPSMHEAASRGETLKRRVVNYLQERRFAELDRVTIGVRGDTVILQGTVTSPAARRLCLNCCRRVAGVLQVEDELEVSGPVQRRRPIAELAAMATFL